MITLRGGDEMSSVHLGNLGQGVVIFGEAQVGPYMRFSSCKDLAELMECFGEPPDNTMGLHYAVKALLSEKPCIFFRVTEEGYSVEEYYCGLQNLDKIPDHTFSAIFIPGMSNQEFVNAALRYCHLHQHLLFMNPADFYDWMVS